MTKAISEKTCYHVTRDLLDGDSVTIKDMMSKYGLAKNTVLDHAKGDCKHRTVHLGYCELNGWVREDDVVNSREFTQSDCLTCGGELDEGGVCGFCRRVAGEVKAE